ncbi:uncharacterized protein LOC134380915 [Cynocephalus volans]|uniref:uncharacterized protein LOC134380915 n=1 Tax=Cynocephalus volans TaxID=110931 RepID=UPI002FCABD28
MEEQGGQGVRRADFAFSPALSGCGPAAEEAVVVAVAAAAAAATRASSRRAAYGRRRESGRRGAEARSGEAGRKGREPSADLSSVSLRPAVRSAAAPGGHPDSSDPGSDGAEIAGPGQLARLEPACPVAGAASLPAPDPAVRKGWGGDPDGERPGKISEPRACAGVGGVRCVETFRSSLGQPRIRREVLRIPLARRGKLENWKLVSLTAGTEARHIFSAAGAARASCQNRDLAQGWVARSKATLGALGSGASLFLGRRSVKTKATGVAAAVSNLRREIAGLPATCGRGKAGARPRPGKPPQPDSYLGKKS